MNAFILALVSIVVVAALSLLIYLKAPHWLKRAYGMIVVFVAAVAACLLLSSFSYQRGFDTALSHQTAPLVRTLDALDQIHAGNVDGATRNIEEVCFWLANDLLEDERYQSDLGGISALTPRLAEYWNTYCADRTERAWTEKRFGDLLAGRR